MPPESLAGFRLVRKLGSGSRADVFLGHAGTESPRTAAVKVFHPQTSAPSIDAEIRALSQASHAHVVALRDLSTGEDGRPVLLLERLELGSLAHLVATRSTLSPGEAVTILAPLAAAVGAIHASGVSHRAISPHRVLFRESGAPVLTGFGHATIEGDDPEADNRALASLARGVLEKVDESDALRSWLESLVGYPRGFSEQLSARLFELAAATPVLFAPDPGGLERVPSRTTISPVPVIEQVETPHRSLRSTLEPYLSRVPERFRRPRYAAIGAGAVALVVAIAVVPSGEPAASSTVAVPEAVPTPAAVDDDPVSAFETLMQTRDQCVRDLSVLCLDAALQQGSAAMADDMALIRSIEKGDGGSADLGAHDVTIVERMGDAVLVSYSTANGKPASALLVKGEAGWRIRSYVPG